MPCGTDQGSGLIYRTLRSLADNLSHHQESSQNAKCSSSPTHLNPPTGLKATTKEERKKAGFTEPLDYRLWITYAQGQGSKISKLSSSGRTTEEETPKMILSSLFPEQKVNAHAQEKAKEKQNNHFQSLAFHPTKQGEARKE